VDNIKDGRQWNGFEMVSHAMQTTEEFWSFSNWQSIGSF